MIELEENSKLIETLNNKLMDLGESLWHKKNRRGTKKIRTANYEKWFLERF